jgi:hypothetical protein
MIVRAQTTIAAMGVVPSLIRCLRYSTRALSHDTNNPQYELAHPAHLTPSLVSMLSNHVPALKRQATIALGNLSVNDSNEVLIVQHNALPVPPPSDSAFRARHLFANTCNP